MTDANPSPLDLATDEELLDAIQRRFDAVIIGAMRRVNSTDGEWTVQTAFRFREKEPFQAAGFSDEVMNKMEQWHDERFSAE
jgi:hypothetical protein